MGLFHYNSLKVCLLSLQYNPVGVGTFFFFFQGFLHVCITSVINGSAHRRHSGTKAWKKDEARRPCHHLHAYQCVGFCGV